MPVFGEWVVWGCDRNISILHHHSFRLTGTSELFVHPSLPGNKRFMTNISVNNGLLNGVLDNNDAELVFIPESGMKPVACAASAT